VADDHRQRAGVHEVHFRQVQDDAALLAPDAGKVLVELAAGHDVELTADRDDHAVVAVLGREAEFRHVHLRTASQLREPLPSSSYAGRPNPAAYTMHTHRSVAGGKLTPDGSAFGTHFRVRARGG
jgi:hypothetical protein